jgi:hypothetical protein
VNASERPPLLDEAERLRLLRIFDEVLPGIDARPAAEVDAEIAEIRAARHGHPVLENPARPRQ